MLAYVAIIHIYLKNSSHSRHEEACKDKMAYVAIIHMYLKISILIQGMERPAKTKLFPAKLCAVLACADTLISQISPRKRIFLKNHFSLLIRGPDGFDS